MKTKDLLVLALAAGAFALSACTTVHETAPARTTTTTTEETSVHPAVSSTTTVSSGATVY
jgi:hypothetical protein